VVPSDVVAPEVFRKFEIGRSVLGDFSPHRVGWWWQGGGGAGAGLLQPLKHARHLHRRPCAYLFNRASLPSSFKGELRLSYEDEKIFLAGYSEAGQ
jgi:hypothetical protein